MDNYLQQGVAAAKAGNRSRAFDLLTQASEIPATSEQAWLWLSSVVNDDSERLFCLNNVLRINPVNTAAQRGAEMLKQKGVFPAMPVYPEPQRSAVVQSFTPKNVSSQKTPQFDSTPTESPRTTFVPVVAPTQQPSSYDTDWKKMEIAGYYDYAVMALANKRPYKVVEKSLVSRGASPEIAKAVMKDADDAVCKARREKYKKQMRRGFILTIVGLMISCCTYLMADSLGGKFYLFYGAIFFGVIDLVVGIFGWIANW